MYGWCSVGRRVKYIQALEVFMKSERGSHDILKTIHRHRSLITLNLFWVKIQNWATRRRSWAFLKEPPPAQPSSMYLLTTCQKGWRKLRKYRSVCLLMTLQSGHIINNIPHKICRHNYQPLCQYCVLGCYYWLSSHQLPKKQYLD